MAASLLVAIIGSVAAINSAIQSRRLANETDRRAAAWERIRHL